MQVLNECWPAMVVEGIHVEDIFELVSLVLSLLYPGRLGFWPIRKTNTLLCLENIKPIFCL